MSKLLSDDELRKEIDKILYGEHEQPYSTGDTIFNLIYTQKHLYAESIIGKDEIDREWHCPCGTTHPLIGSNDVRNQLRAEQRGRIIWHYPLD